MLVAKTLRTENINRQMGLSNSLQWWWLRMNIVMAPSWNVFLDSMPFLASLIIEFMKNIKFHISIYIQKGLIPLHKKIIIEKSRKTKKKNFEHIFWPSKYAIKNLKWVFLLSFLQLCLFHCIFICNISLDVLQLRQIKKS